MGAVEEGAKLTGTFFEALKREPLSLALVVMNLSLLGFFWLILNAVAAQREREVNLLYEDKKEVRELIAKCVVPTPQQRTNYSPIGLPELSIPAIKNAVGGNHE